jgi:hypothetical protein
VATGNPPWLGLFAFRPLSEKQKKITLCALCDFAVNYYPTFRHGVGICTGTVLAGNTGSEDRLSYALIGDSVNLGSRIQECVCVNNDHSHDVVTKSL